MITLLIIKEITNFFFKYNNESPTKDVKIRTGKKTR